MPKQNEEKIVSFNKEQMFNLVADIDRYSEFLPWCNKSTIVKKEKNSETSVVVADLEIGYGQFIYTYRSNVVMDNDKNFIKVNHIEGPFNYLENEWIFEEISSDSSKIIFSIDFELNIKIFDVLITKFFDKAFQKMVDSFHQRAQDIY
tara:strand:+ start:2789 stop:3232 length:444 start_codon:yes stop_codon:yes gene_type:complete